MSKFKGFILLYRDIEDDELWLKEPFTKGQAWTDLILMANYKDNVFQLGSEMVKAECGSVVTSEQKLMQRWKWSKSRLRAFLNYLERRGSITRKPDRKKTLIMVVNYSNYQTTNQTEGKTTNKTTNETAKTPLFIRDSGKEQTTNETTNETASKTTNQTQTNNNKTNINNNRERERGTPSLASVIDSKSYREKLRAALKKWIDYCEEMGKPFIARSGLEALLTEIDSYLKQYTESQIVELINYSMQNRYRSLYFDRLERTQKGAKQSGRNNIGNREKSHESGSAEPSKPKRGTFEYYKRVGEPAADQGASGKSQHPKDIS